MTEVIDWDCDLFQPSSVDLRIMRNTQTGGRSLGGREQVRTSRAQWWMLDLRLDLIDPDAVRAYRAFLASLDGRANRIRYCLCDPIGGTYTARLRRLAIPDADLARGYVPFNDGATFDGGVGFAFEGGVFAASQLQTQLDTFMADASNPIYELRTTVVSAAVGLKELNVLDAADVVVGGYVSVLDDLYMVTRKSGNALTVSPNIRRTYNTGEAVEVSHPKVQMRLAEDDSGSHNIRLGTLARDISISMVEAFDR